MASRFPTRGVRHVFYRNELGASYNTTAAFLAVWEVALSYGDKKN